MAVIVTKPGKYAKCICCGSDLKRTEEYKKQYDAELSDINATFDLLGVPRHVRNNYHSLTANARLTLFLAQTNGIKVEQPKEGE